jgi:hypothetical protein
VYKIEVLYIRPNYNEEFNERNRDLVGFVVEKATGKVKKTSIIQRDSLGTWFHDNRAQFPESKYELLMGSISIIGTLSGASMRDGEDENEEHDPLAYRVN